MPWFLAQLSCSLLIWYHRQQVSKVAFSVMKQFIKQWRWRGSLRSSLPGTLTLHPPVRYSVREGLSSSGAKLLTLPPAGRGRGRSFEGSSPPSQPQVTILGRHFHSWLAFWGGCFLLQLPGSIPPPLNCVTWTPRVPFLQLKDCQGSRTSKRGGQKGALKLVDTWSSLL